MAFLDGFTSFTLSLSLSLYLSISLFSLPLPPPTLSHILSLSHAVQADRHNYTRAKYVEQQFAGSGTPPAVAAAQGMIINEIGGQNASSEFDGMKGKVQWE